MPCYHRPFQKEFHKSFICPLILIDCENTASQELQRLGHCWREMTIDLCFLIHLNLLLLQKANLKPDTFLHVHIPPEGQGGETDFLADHKSEWLNNWNTIWYQSLNKIMTLSTRTSEMS